ncbi:Sodium/hydrogen exchanger family-domain-containing protein [Ochromonadaceae sp. CCMP2298]|nr:Sodium/hydrogen exchanger family-domain-containing protein [Ochromonadaceae sp. CCMP2298]
MKATSMQVLALLAMHLLLSPCGAFSLSRPQGQKPPASVRARTPLRASPADLLPLVDLHSLGLGLGHAAAAVEGSIGAVGGSFMPFDFHLPGTDALSLPSLVTAGESSSLDPLGNDLLIFLFATIGIVPLFKWLDASPVLGFLAAGLVMGPAGLRLFSDLSDMESLAEFGVLFLLFEQGLELTVERLRSLSKYAFGMGTAQVLLCTGAFFVFPFLGGVQFLEFFVRAEPSVVDITRLDEAVVIGAALSLSSSAFVLKILQEKNQLSTKFGSAALGVLLMQDIAVVPLLVLLPIIENNSGGAMPLSEQAALLGATILKAIVGLGGILVVGGAIVRFLFSIVAKSRSSETFVALCLLVAVGIGALTDSLGLSSTLGAFVAGTLLAESNYRTQIETDIKPFKGLLLGLFFLTTGASVDPYVIQQQWPTVLALLTGLVTFKTIIISVLGPFFGLSRAESVRTGLLLSGGGEFAFVVLTLADKLNVLPDQLAKMLVGVVVLSMALTPYLSMLGDKVAEVIQEQDDKEAIEVALRSGTAVSASAIRESDSLRETEGEVVEPAGEDTIVVCGYGTVGETVVRFLTSPQVGLGGAGRLRYLAFDLDPTLVMQGYKNGYRILYGDGSQPMVLATAGVTSPKAFVVTYGEPENAFKAVERLRQAFPSVPIVARAATAAEYYHLIEAGAAFVVSDEREASFRLAGNLLYDLGLSTASINSVKQEVGGYLDQVQELTLEKKLAPGKAPKKTWVGVGATKVGAAWVGDRREGVTGGAGAGEGEEAMDSLVQAARRNLDNIVDSLQSLSEEYVWVSDEEVAARISATAGVKSTGSLQASGSSITRITFDDEEDTVSTLETGTLETGTLDLDELGVKICILPPTGGVEEVVVEELV